MDDAKNRRSGSETIKIQKNIFSERKRKQHQTFKLNWLLPVFFTITQVLPQSQEAEYLLLIWTDADR